MNYKPTGWCVLILENGAMALKDQTPAAARRNGVRTRDGLMEAAFDLVRAKGLGATSVD